MGMALFDWLCAISPPSGIRPREATFRAFEAIQFHGDLKKQEGTFFLAGFLLKAYLVVFEFVKKKNKYLLWALWGVEAIMTDARAVMEAMGPVIEILTGDLRYDSRPKKEGIDGCRIEWGTAFGA